MTIAIREANLNTDRQVLIDMTYNNLTMQSVERRFDWLYRDNPYGVAQAWIVYNKKDDMVIGAAAAFPRLVQVCGEDIVCWNLGDFAIDKSFRSLGPAILLQRACLTPIMEGKIPFCYDHPHDSMMAIYKRMGITASGRVVRFMKPLKIGAKIRPYVGGGVIAKGLSAMGDRILAHRDRGDYADRGYNIAHHESRFGDEFSELDTKVAIRYKVCGRRTAEYLNWRYRDNPLLQYEVITLRHREKLLAYAIFTLEGQDAILTDIFGEHGPEVIETLLSGIIEILRRRQIVTINAPVLESSPLIPFLEKTGFSPRESSPVVFYTQQNGRFDGVITEVKNWFLTYGDRDS